MGQTLLISGPSGCGKSTLIPNRIRIHRGPCGFLRLVGYPGEGLLQARDGGIDLAWLQDQCPGLLDRANPDQALAPRPVNLLALIELPQIQPPADPALAGVDRRVIPQQNLAGSVCPASWCRARISIPPPSRSPSPTACSAMPCRRCSRLPCASARPRPIHLLPPDRHGPCRDLISACQPRRPGGRGLGGG